LLQEKLYIHANDLSTGNCRKKRTQKVKEMIPPLG
jgi:hypothetical protein